MDQLINSEEYKQFKSKINSDQQANLFFRFFRWHGKFCASRPWEVIFLTFTLIVSLLSLTYFQPSSNKFGEYTSLKSSFLDSVVLMTVRCGALIYAYVQFSRLRRLSSNHMLVIACSFSIVISFFLSLSLLLLFNTAFKQLNEALPYFFFLFFIDIPKACTLAKFALTSEDRAQVVGNIGDGMGLLAPALSLDSLTTCLVLAVGSMACMGVFSSVCSFCCFCILSNHLVFVSFYPACLAIMCELLRQGQPRCGAEQWWDDGLHQRSNLVVDKVKVVMSAVLVFFHLHTFYADLHTSSASSSARNLTPFKMQLSPFSQQQQQQPLMGDNSMGDLRLDTILTVVLAGFLAVKYICLDSPPAPAAHEGGSKKGKGILKSIKEVTFEQQEGEVLTQPSHTEPKTSARVEAGQVRAGSCGVDGVFENFLKSSILEEQDAPHKTISKFTVGPAPDDDDYERDDDDGNDEENDSVERFSRNRSVQTDHTSASELHEPIKCMQAVTCDQGEPIRSLEECVELLKDVGGPRKLSDREVMALVASKRLPAYRLETALDDFQRGVNIRRQIISEQLGAKDSLMNIPFLNYDYKYVHGACCENVIGYLPIPVGVAGPLLVDGMRYHVPMATTEGCLVASANRGCRALLAGGGVRSSLLENGMTRAPLVRFASAMRASEAKRWMEANFELVAEAFNSTSRFARLKGLKIKQASRNLYVRFVAITGDAMGMNMLSKGSERALQVLQEEHLSDMQIISLSSNFCTDKKPNAINWIDGRGKSVVCEAVIPGKVVREVLKTSVKALVDLNIHKNLIGSTLAGSIGGSNAHAANIVTAIFIATGQDPAQNVCSSNCLTIMEEYEEEKEEEESSVAAAVDGTMVDARVDGREGDVPKSISGTDQEKHTVSNDSESGGERVSGERVRGERGVKKETGLYVSCNMPSLEVGTVGGGTILPPQAACLEMMGVRGAHKEVPGENATRLARVICSMVMAGELSLMSSLASGDLVQSHLKHNRSSLSLGQPPQCMPI